MYRIPLSRTGVQHFLWLVWLTEFRVFVCRFHLKGKDSQKNVRIDSKVSGVKTFTFHEVEWAKEIGGKITLKKEV